MNEVRRRLPISRGALYGLIATYVSSILMVAVAIWYANYVDRQSNRQWCELIVSIDDAYSGAPATNPSGKKVAEEFHRLRTQFAC